MELDNVVNMVISCELDSWKSVEESLADGYTLEYIAPSLNLLLEEEVHGGLTEHLAGKFLGQDKWRIARVRGTWTYALLTLNE